MITVRLEHENHDCIIYAPHVGSSYCGCHFIVSENGKVVASVRHVDALNAVKRLFGFKEGTR